MLREYQQKSITEASDLLRAGVRRILFVSPTGSGKTVMAAAIIQRAVNRGRRVLFVAHRRELVTQPSRILTEHGISHGILQGGSGRGDAGAAVQIATTQTLARRDLPQADLVILDEAHRAQAGQNQALFAHYRDAVMLGLTATPRRTDGRGLGRDFDHMLQVATIPELIGQGWLVRPRLFGPDDPDLSATRVRGGDYSPEDLAVMDDAKLVGNIIEHWQKLGGGRPTAAFCHSVAAADRLARRFKGVGVSAASVSGRTAAGERDDRMAAWQAGEITVLCNCQLLVEGIDYPALAVIVNAAPTISITKYRQMVGRALRPAPGKREALILDHTGSWRSLGAPWEEPPWTLDDAKQKRRTVTPNPVTYCGQCFAVNPSRASTCATCGSPRVTRPRTALEEDEARELEEIRRVERRGQERSAQTLADFQRIAKERGYHPGWAHIRAKLRRA